MSRVPSASLLLFALALVACTQSRGAGSQPASAATAAPAGGTPSSAAPASIAYDAKVACVAGRRYANDVLPDGKGEFATNGFDRAWWGRMRGNPIGGERYSGFRVSWGRHQFDTYFGDRSDGLGYDPFSYGADTAVSGNPRALSIEARPVPAPIATSLSVLANDQWPVSNPTRPFSLPAEGDSVEVNVEQPTGAQIGWRVGLGFAGAPIMFVGVCTAGCDHGGVHDGTSPWTISNVHVYSGVPGTLIVPGVNDEGGLRAYSFPRYYSGVLDTPVDLQYGLFVARVRLPPPLPGASPAFWLLTNDGTPKGSHGPLNGEWDIQEMFGNVLGDGLNAGTSLWNSGAGKPQNWGGTFAWPNAQTTTPSRGYHDFAALILPGGAAISHDFNGAGGPGYINGTPGTGVTNYLDGSALPGHAGGADVTSGVHWKELMLMFQVGAPGGWLGTPRPADFPAYYRIQWVRVYRPTAAAC